MVSLHPQDDVWQTDHTEIKPAGYSLHSEEKEYQA